MLTCRTCFLTSPLRVGPTIPFRIHSQRLCSLIRIIDAEAYKASACAGNEGIRVGFIQALWHADIVSQAYTGFYGRVGESGLNSIVV